MKIYSLIPVLMNVTWLPESQYVSSHSAEKFSINSVGMELKLLFVGTPRSYRLNEPPAKGGVWNGLPRLAHSHAQSSATRTSVDVLSWARRSQRE